MSLRCWFSCTYLPDSSLLTLCFFTLQFTGKIAIRKGVHPLLACVRGADNVVPNDAFADEDTAFFLVTGPNMSGKTTYLKQIALLTIMASIGSFVPAEYASFKHMQVILTRFSNADDTQHNL